MGFADFAGADLVTAETFALLALGAALGAGLGAGLRAAGFLAGAAGFLLALLGAALAVLAGAFLVAFLPAARFAGGAAFFFGWVLAIGVSEPIPDRYLYCRLLAGFSQQFRSTCTHGVSFRKKAAEHSSAGECGILAQVIGHESNCMNPAPSLTPELLAKLIPMGALRPESKRDLARNATLLDVRAGQFLFRSGERADKALYLLEGQVELREPSGTVVGKVVGETAAAQHRLPRPSPRKLEAYCVTDVRCVAVDNHLLDVMLTWDQTDALEVGEVGTESSDSDDWMTRLLQTPAFQMVPPANLQAIFMRMQRVDAAPGQTIVTQGEAGDFFYVITEGRCIVTREQPGQKAVRLAELETGSCFGEEALISDAPRNATVTMLTRGSLMRLAKDDFRKLLKEPLTRRVSRSEGDALVESGRGIYVDVRLPSEFQNGSLPGALNIPLYMLRMRLAQLPKDKGLICICDTGRRSSVASFVLTQKGFEAYTLSSGLNDAA